MKDDRTHLLLTRQQISELEEYLRGYDWQRFKADRRNQSAVILKLLLIGEEAKKISDTTKGCIPLPWPEIVGFRNKAIHEYFAIDLEEVWKTWTDDIPALRNELSTYLKRYSE